MEPRPFYQYEEEARALGREAFLARYRAPFLIVYDPLPELEGDEAAIETGKFAALREKRPTPKKPASGSLVMALVKSPKLGNLFPGMITVGRARNNDLVLPSREVSSFHAYFASPSDRNRSWTVCDAESSNGTLVEGQPAPKPTPVQSGGEVCFARVRCRFFAPEELWALCSEEQPA